MTRDQEIEAVARAILKGPGLRETYRWWCDEAEDLAGYIVDALAPIRAAEVAEARRAALEERSREVEGTLEQALSCILGETPEDCTPEEARQDTINRIRRALSPVPAAAPDAREAEVALVPRHPTDEMLVAGLHYLRTDSATNLEAAYEVMIETALAARGDGKGAG